MIKKINQTDTGKAFEYSIAKAYYDYLSSKGLNIKLIQDDAFIKTKESYDKFNDSKQNQYNIAAKATIETICYIEPALLNQQNDNDILEILLMPDKAGQQGDVRDIIFRRPKSKWEIGFSAKNNHDATKHSRLSIDNDFAKEWLDYNCSQTYFKDISPIFQKIIDLRKHNKEIKWKELPYSKEDGVYLPLLSAFKNEIMLLDSQHKDIPKKLLNYLLGRYSFYKIIKRDQSNTVIVKAFNINRDLNKTYNAVKPRATTDILELPSRIIELAFKPNSKTTLLMVLDKGWQISFRIHSADGPLTPSLKFDIQLEGNPPILFTQHLFP